MSRAKLTGGPATRALSFEDDESGSAERARSTGAVIRSSPGATFAVALTDRPVDEPHEARLAYDAAAEVHHGWCDCDGFRFHDGPCAHLWALYVGEERKAVSIPTVSELATEGATCPLCGAEHAEARVGP